ncbi:hypothetical protein SAMN05216436_10197 [bacterium A37T11]|nr:hypothetical protein SAMN05216436_10197 [bacterium A37T11]
MTMNKAIILLLLTTALMGCRKITHTTMNAPAYLKVFNSLNYRQLLNAKDDTLSYLCMLVNPEFDANGMPVSAGIVGDFLDRRDTYAPPYPTHIGVSTTVDNPEYPGKEVVLAGPVVNGFDLSSWAQVPSGTSRVVFLYRPKNEVPFFNLESRNKRSVLVDTTINLTAGEVYTMHVLMKDFKTREKGILLRRENFHKLSLSDSLVYVNFYNYSAKGFLQAGNELKIPTGKMRVNLFEQGVRDTMNVFLNLYTGQDFFYYEDGIVLQNSTIASSAYDGRFLTTVVRDLSSGTARPYVSFPLWVRGDDDGIHTDLWERFYLLAPGLNLKQSLFQEEGAFYDSGTIITSEGQGLYGGVLDEVDGNFAAINCLLNGQKIYTDGCFGCLFRNYHAGVNFPNLVVNIHSGIYNPKSFATVNTIEIINGEVYLTAVQRKFAPPAY